MLSFRLKNEFGTIHINVKVRRIETLTYENFTLPFTWENFTNTFIYNVSNGIYPKIVPPLA